MSTTLTPRFRACASRAIASALGKPWQVSARGPDSFDCWGFILWVYAQGGIILPDWTYSREDSRASLFGKGIEEAVAKGFQRAAPLSPYSVVTLGRKGLTTHVAIYAEDAFWHAADNRGVIGSTPTAMRHLFTSFEYWYPE